MFKQTSQFPVLILLIINLYFLNHFFFVSPISAAETPLATSEAHPINVWYPLFSSLSASLKCTAASKNKLYSGDLDACSTGVVPAPRFGLSNMVYPLSSIEYSSLGYHTITFNFGYLGPDRYPRCHVGLDIYPASSSPQDNIVRAIANGTVFRLSHLWGDSDTGGVDILHQDCTGSSFIIRYGEFADYGDSVYESLKIGQTISAGQQLGTLSRVSKHVHLELHLYSGEFQKYYGAGSWTINGSDPGYADACATHATQTSMCSSSNPAAKRLLNIRNVLWEAAEQTWPDRTFGPVKSY